MSTSDPNLLPPDACEFRFVHSSGPGGQHVNKASTAVELRVDVSLLGLDSQAQRRRCAGYSGGHAPFPTEESAGRYCPC